ncbi:MlaD family protein [Bacteriovoracaceae bacterium]|nr:MlaD family protein [Bacteriovoracaceae bacterium]
MNEFKVGLLTLLAIASMIVVTIKISANKSGFGRYYEYRAIIEDASGIYPNSSIKVAGINAGRIKSLELSGSQALLIFEIIENINVTKNSVLKIKSVGILGDKFIDLYLGEKDDLRLEEGSYLPVKGGGGFEQLSKDAGDVLEEVKLIAQAIRESMINEKNENVMRKIVGNIDRITDNTARITKSIGNLVEKNEKKVDDMVTNFHALSDQLAFETNRFEKDSVAYQLSKIEPIMENANKTMEDMSDIVANVKAGKGTVGKLLTDEAVIDQVSTTLTGVNRLVNRVNNFQTDIAIYSGVNSLNGSHTQFDLDLYPSPERFFRLGVVNNTFGPQVTTNTEVTEEDEDGNEVTTLRREVDSSALKVNLQVGRRFNRYAIRAGLIETKGGLGFDYFFPNIGARSGVEVFDYQEDFGPNVRLYSEFKLWNILYTRVSGEDLGNTARSFTISAGLRFTDEDLASLIGLVSSN